MKHLLIALFISSSGEAPGSTPFEQAVAFDVEREVRPLLQGYLRGQKLPTEPMPLTILRDLDPSAAEPWLRGIEVKLQIPGGVQHQKDVERLLRAHFVSRGFQQEVDGQMSGDRPQFHLAVSAFPSLRTQDFSWWQAMMGGAFLIVLGLFGLLLMQSRPTMQLPGKLRGLVEEEPTDPQSLSLASPEQLKRLFRSIPIGEAMTILATLSPQDRTRVLDALRIQRAVRSRVERRLLRIQADR